MARKFAHDPVDPTRPGLTQRICEWRESDGTWRVAEPGDDDHEYGDVCRMDHPMTKVEVTLETDDQIAAYQSKVGEGTATLGSGIRGLMVPAKEDEYKPFEDEWAARPGHLFVLGDGGGVTANWDIRFNPDGMSVEFADGKGYSVPAVTPEAREACSLIHDVMNKFLVKNAQYAKVQSGHDLGIMGIIPDINRKTAALIGRVWRSDLLEAVPDGQDSTEELLEDLIGHCLLMLAKMSLKEA